MNLAGTVCDYSPSPIGFMGMLRASAVLSLLWNTVAMPFRPVLNLQSQKVHSKGFTNLQSTHSEDPSSFFTCFLE